MCVFQIHFSLHKCVKCQSVFFYRLFSIPSVRFYFHFAWPTVYLFSSYVYTFCCYYALFSTAMLKFEPTEPMQKCKKRELWSFGNSWAAERPKEGLKRKENGNGTRENWKIKIDTSTHTQSVSHKHIHTHSPNWNMTWK